jgi:hypothetical protein
MSNINKNFLEDLEKMDLNITNYSVDELLVLFQIDYTMKPEDMKRAKKEVLMMHPDKSRLPKEYFLFFSQAYRYLYRIYEFKQKERNREQSTEYSDFTEKETLTIDVNDFCNTGDNSSTKKASVKEFSKWFNQTFEELKQEDESKNAGYGDWLCGTEDTDNSSEDDVSNLGAMHTQIEKRKQAARNNSLVSYQGIQDLVAQSSRGGCQINDEKPKSYASGEMFSKLQYEDLRVAHTETVIPVTDEDFRSRKQYKNVHEMHMDRGRNITIPTKASQEKILQSKYQEDENESTRLAYTLLQREEVSQKNNELFMKQFRQIGWSNKM